MQTATVRSWNNRFGFLTPDDGGQNVFLHSSVFARSGIGHLERGTRVKFSARPDRFDASRAAFVTEIVIDDGAK